MLYQLSYASPSHAETAAANLKPCRSRARTHSRSGRYHGTKIKVSTPADAEQTEPDHRGGTIPTSPPCPQAPLPWLIYLDRTGEEGKPVCSPTFCPKDNP